MSNFDETMKFTRGRDEASTCLLYTSQIGYKPSFFDTNSTLSPSWSACDSVIDV